MFASSAVRTGASKVSVESDVGASQSAEGKFAC